MSTLEITRLLLPAAPLGRENPLPDIGGGGDAHSHLEIDRDRVSPEEARYMGYAPVGSILPYTMQDGYGRKRCRRAFKAAVLENEHLRATFLPQMGGRLYALFDKDAGRELLHVNPVIQPCNLALRNGWVSGGVEWNVGIIGHTPFTLSDMACQRLAFSDGTPVLRMFEYERIRHLHYRIEAFLPDGARELYVRVRIDNALNEETAVYWWSNMAVDERKDVRVIAPAQEAFCYGYGGAVTKIPVPHFAVPGREGQTWDASRPTSIPQAMDFFYDVHEDARPFIYAPGADGYGMCQTSTRELRGRKLFVWGMNAGGRHWQSFLSRHGHAYIEMQSGLARTQLEHLPMGGRQHISWLESYGALRTDPAKTQGEDWAQAVRAAQQALCEARPEKTLEAWHARAKCELDICAMGEVIHRGEGFARCEKALRGDDFDTCGLLLEAGMRVGQKESPWLALAKHGTFPCPPPMEEPTSFMTGAAWEQALLDAVQSPKGDHWYARYQLGVMAAARGDLDAAKAQYAASLAHARNPWALRDMAVIAARQGDRQEAAHLLLSAVRIKPIRPLAVEALAALLCAGDDEGVLALCRTLPERVLRHGRVQAYRAAALMRTGRLDDARSILEGGIELPDVREGDTLLSDLWFEMMARSEYGRADEAALADVKTRLVPPKKLDFRMK